MKLKETDIENIVLLMVTGTVKKERVDSTIKLLESLIIPDALREDYNYEEGVRYLKEFINK